MPRQPRIDIGDNIYHVINSANARLPIFTNDKEYALFEELLLEAKELTGMRILAYCIMPNHWHLVLYPLRDGELSSFMQWLTNTHTRTWHVRHGTIGTGHLYQGRYKSFLVQNDTYALQVLRYVEQNPLRAKLVKRSEQWRWGSLWRREQGTEQQKSLLNQWPVTIPRDYLTWVNQHESEEELQILRNSVNKGKPFGAEVWMLDTVERYGLEATLRGPGRPKR